MRNTKHGYNCQCLESCSVKRHRACFWPYHKHSLNHHEQQNILSHQNRLLQNIVLNTPGLASYGCNRLQSVLVSTYFIAKQYRQMGRTTSSNNINYGPSHNNFILNRYRQWYTYNTNFGIHLTANQKTKFEKQNRLKNKNSDTQNMSLTS